VIQKKVCMLGAFAVGKTSLVERFVRSLFSDRYLTTVGVKIDKKVVAVGGAEVGLVIWDLAGEDQFQRVRTSYLRGASGYLLVVDGTRRGTLDEAARIQDRVEGEHGKLPFVVLLNKADLEAEWELHGAANLELGQRGWVTVRTSAKSGDGVERAFSELAGMMVGGRG
jgi:hypothetical protein